MSQPAPLEPAAIEALRALSPDDPGFLRELVDIYLQDTPKRLAELEAAMARNDGPTLTRAAHTIKGSSANFGATALTKLAQEIESQGKAANFSAVAVALPAMQAEFTRVSAALRQQTGGT